MRTAGLCAALLGLSLGSAAFAQESAVLTAPLTYTPLPSPDGVVSRPVEEELSSEKGPSAGKRLEFKGQRSVKIELCGEQISLVANGDGTVAARTGSREQVLRTVPKLGTLQSAYFAFGDARKYLLAFPTREGTGSEITLTCRAGAAQVANIDGQNVWFYDHNTDGMYAVGDDAIRVGEAGKVAVFAPLSSYFATASGVYEITQLAEDGATLQYRKYSGPTGNLAVKFAGAGAEANVVIASSDGLLSTVVTGGGKAKPPVTLLPGHYEIVAAIVSSPAQGRVVSLIEKGTVPAIDIVEGQTTTVELGAPLALEFRADLRSNTEVSIESKSLKVRGKSGEAYSAVQWIGQPDMSLVSGGVTRKLNRSVTGGQNGGCYMVQIPEIKGHARAKIVIAGSVDGLGMVRGETPLD